MKKQLKYFIESLGFGFAFVGILAWIVIFAYFLIERKNIVIGESCPYIALFELFGFTLALVFILSKNVSKKKNNSHLEVISSWHSSYKPRKVTG